MVVIVGNNYFLENYYYKENMSYGFLCFPIYYRQYPQKFPVLIITKDFKT